MIEIALDGERERERFSLLAKPVLVKERIIDQERRTALEFLPLGK